MKKIVIIGPESTGKSTLTEALARYYHCPFIPEYARIYVEKICRPYTYADVEIIAKHQIEEINIYENRFSKSVPYLFIDTDLIITRVWFQHVFHYEPDWLKEAICQNAADFYLLCRPDLPWQPDPVRENGNIRDHLYRRYKREIETIGKPFAEIEGFDKARLQNAICSISLLK